MNLAPEHLQLVFAFFGKAYLPFALVCRGWRDSFAGSSRETDPLAIMYDENWYRMYGDLLTADAVARRWTLKPQCPRDLLGRYSIDELAVPMAKYGNIDGIECLPRVPGDVETLKSMAKAAVKHEHMRVVRWLYNLRYKEGFRYLWNDVVDMILFRMTYLDKREMMEKMIKEYLLFRGTNAHFHSVSLMQGAICSGNRELCDWLVLKGAALDVVEYCTIAAEANQVGMLEEYLQDYRPTTNEILSMCEQAVTDDSLETFAYLYNRFGAARVGSSCLRAAIGAGSWRIIDFLMEVDWTVMPMDLHEAWNNVDLYDRLLERACAQQVARKLARAAAAEERREGD